MKGSQDIVRLRRTLAHWQVTVCTRPVAIHQTDDSCECTHEPLYTIIIST